METYAFILATIQKFIKPVQWIQTNKIVLKYLSYEKHNDYCKPKSLT